MNAEEVKTHATLVIKQNALVSEELSRRLAVCTQQEEQLRSQLGQVVENKAVLIHALESIKESTTLFQELTQPVKIEEQKNG